jgi:glycosyltransferase 2 family protein
LKGLRVVLGIVISTALLAVLLWSVDLHELTTQLARTRWGWTTLGAFLALLGLWVRAHRWRYLFPPRSDPPGLVPAMMIGYMVNNVLPLRAGELVRVYVVARRWGRGFWTALATLIVERVLDSLAIILVLGMLVLLIPVPPIFRWTAVTLLVIDALAVAALVTLTTAPATCIRVVTRLTRRWPGLGARAVTVFDGLDGIRTPAHLLPMLAWTTLVWLVPALAAWTMLRALDIKLSLLAGWTVLAFVGLGVSIPSAPGYVGVFHYAAVLALEMFDVPRSASLGYAILFHASQIIPITVVGWIFLLREHMSFGEATQRRPLPSASGD